MAERVQVIFLTTFITRNQSYRELLDEKLKYGYIHKHIQQPLIDEAKWGLLQFLVEQDRSLTPMQRERYIITTMLVQIALDTHDLVPIKKVAETEQETLSKQLQVLSGDYYSGLYYFLLSEVGEIEFIQTLANAIREINELKMALYYKDSPTFHERINFTKKINSMLIIHVTQFLYDDTANDLITDWLILQQLELEREYNNSVIAETTINAYQKNVSNLAQTLSNQTAFITHYIQDQQNDNVKISTRL